MTCWREGLRMDCQTTVQRDWVHERSDCWYGLLKNNRRLPLGSAVLVLVQVGVVEPVVVPSQHWMWT